MQYSYVGTMWAAADTDTQSVFYVVMKGNVFVQQDTEQKMQNEEKLLRVVSAAGVRPLDDGTAQKLRRRSFQL